jgi:hypothetical protein
MPSAVAASSPPNTVLAHAIRSGAIVLDSLALVVASGIGSACGFSLSAPSLPFLFLRPIGRLLSCCGSSRCGFAMTGWSVGEGDSGTRILRV